MKKNKCFIAGIVTIGLATLAVPRFVEAQAGSNRIELQRHDLNVPNREVIQVVVTISKGQTAPRHNHPGEEVIYVLEGSLEYYIEGRAPITVKSGQVAFVPAGVIHSVKNVGDGDAKELATYIVEKGKPLITLAK